MSADVINYIDQYGYIAIFLLVFLQELGIPSPVPSELILMFTGYLSFKTIIFLPWVIAISLISVVTGTLIIYYIFYFSGGLLINKKPKWIPVSDKTIARITDKITSGGLTSIYIFRMISITRGYSSVIVGLLRIKPVKFLPVVLISALAWVSLWALLGYLLGPYWDMLISNMHNFKYLLAGLVVIIILIILFRALIKKKILRTRAGNT
jgi:membrane protein DedA with SNARE-associated domain